MYSKTTSVTLNLSKDDIFSYLSDIRNLPIWATEFCKELKEDNGKYKIISPMGELFFKIDSNEKTGKIDMYYGPSEDKMAVLNTTVTSLKNSSSEITCTCHQDSTQSNEEFNRQFESLKRELVNLQNSFF